MTSESSQESTSPIGSHNAIPGTRLRWEDFADETLAVHAAARSITILVNHEYEQNGPSEV